MRTPSHQSLRTSTVTLPIHRNPQAVVGAEALSEEDLLYLRFTEAFEGKFISQGAYEVSVN